MANAAPDFPSIVSSWFTFCQPLLINRYLQFLQDPTESMSIGYGLLGAYGVVYLGLAVFFMH
jgi:ATP-binding cassette, subfamily C (CFTR/MRP), member 1